MRTPGDVLTWRVGTPLDTVVVLAAALEQAGIRPLLWLADGHAFLGYWREERSAESAATTDAVAAGQPGRPRADRPGRDDAAHAQGEPGADLHRPAYTGWLTGELDRILGVTDVHRARRDGIVPLPARARDAERRPAGRRVPAGRHSAPAPPEPRAARAGAPARGAAAGAAVEERAARPQPAQPADQLHRALRAGAGRARTPRSACSRTSSTTARRSPCCRPTSWPPSRRSAASTSARELPEEQLTELLVDRREVHADVTTGGYLPRLRNLAYKAKTVLEETGANNLYLALGSLVWELDGRPLRCPLVLIPVTLAPLGRTGSYRLTLDESGASTPNYCLLEKLRQLHGLVVPTLTEPADGGARPRGRARGDARRAGRARAALPGRGDGGPGDPAVRQVPAVEGPRRALGGLRGEPAGRPPGARADRGVRRPGARHRRLRRPRRARRAAARPGRRLAAAGDRRGRPPGARSCSRARPAPASRRPSPTCSPAPSPTGKRVLFVAEKRAALDVVARRLDAVGMGMFALDLHDKGSRASMVRAQIRLALEHAVAVDEQGLAADAEDLRSARRAAGPLRRPAARPRTPPGCRCTRRGRRS